MIQTLAYRSALGAALFLAVPAVTLAAVTNTDTTPAPPAKAASAVGSTLRATTYKIGTALVNLVGYTYAFGSVVDAGMLSVASGTIAWASYIGLDYAWDTFYPLPAKQTADQAFDTSAQAWHTTLKWLTYKPLALAEKYGVLYVYTGSLAATLGWGSALAFANAGFFYVNDIMWDWYDWQAMPPANAVKQIEARG
jgi:uncharacterized membrane protein